MTTAGGIPNYNDYFELSSSKTTLLVIDPQNDFHPGGSLAIANANQDAGRIAKLIKTNAPAIDDVIVSLDTHQRMHVAHGLFWINEAGEHPAPFTPITEADVTAGVWKTTDPKWQTWGMEYVQKLEANNRFVLLIWPEHCLMGSKGHAVVDVINDALQAWAGTKARAIEYIYKGHNMLTEHYSMMKADVECADDPRTQWNAAVFERLRKAERVVVCGQALSHCVAFTCRDLVSRWPKDEMHKLVLLEDCSSAVGGFEGAAAEFVADMKAAGVTVTTSDQLSWDA